MMIVNEFLFLNDSEANDMVERRLLSNGYSDYDVKSIIKSTGTITLVHNKCGTSLKTNMQEIEDGILPHKCQYCTQKRKQKQLMEQQRISKIISDRHLELISVDENNYYIKCQKCGQEYRLDEDFYYDSDPYEMCCKNWNCIISLLKEENHWFAVGIETEEIKVINKSYEYTPGPFLQDTEEWFYDLKYFEWTFQQKCEKCGCETIYTLEDDFDCDACCYANNKFINISKWNKPENIVDVQCLTCGNKYTITIEQANEEIFECFECYKTQNIDKFVCPVCRTENNKQTRFCEECGCCLELIKNNNVNTQEEFTYWLYNTIVLCQSIYNHQNKILSDLKQESILKEKFHNQKYRELLTLIDDMKSQKNKNKEKCVFLKQIIKGIAESNGVVYLTSECTSDECYGICEKCEAEIRYLENELNSKLGGNKIFLSNLKLNDYDDFRNLREIIPFGCTGETKIDKILESPLENIGFSELTFNCLKRSGINTVGELLIKSVDDIKKIRNLKKHSVEEVIDRLSFLGLKLEQE